MKITIKCSFGIAVFDRGRYQFKKGNVGEKELKMIKMHATKQIKKTLEV